MSTLSKLLMGVIFLLSASACRNDESLVTQSPPTEISTTTPISHTAVPAAITSENGGMLAFTSARDGNMEIYLMSTDGSGLTRLTDHPAEDYWPTWSPDGAQIAFASNRDGDFEIYVIDADGSNPQQLTTAAGNDLEPAWSPDGNQIAFKFHFIPIGMGIVNSI